MDTSERSMRRAIVAGRAHVVVDTGFWIFGKKRLIPAGVVQSIDDTNEKVHISLTKDQVKSAPDFDDDGRDDRDDDYETYDTYYAPFGRELQGRTCSASREVRPPQSVSRVA